MSETIQGYEVALIIFLLISNYIIFYCIKRCFECTNRTDIVQIIFNFLLVTLSIFYFSATIIGIGNSHFYKTLMLWYG